MVTKKTPLKNSYFGRDYTPTNNEIFYRQTTQNRNIIRIIIHFINSSHNKTRLKSFIRPRNKNDAEHTSVIRGRVNALATMHFYDGSFGVFENAILFMQKSSSDCD